MISLTIDVRGATPEQLKQFGEIAGMRDVLHELLYRSRGHAETTVAVVGGARGANAHSPDDFLAMVAGPKVAANSDAIASSAEELSSQTGC
jgi:hypothetical protein